MSTKLNLDEVVKSLSELTERPAAEIKAEIEGLMQKHGYNMAGAIATWKSNNKFLIAINRKEYIVRVIAKEMPRANTQDNEQIRLHREASMHFRQMPRASTQDNEQILVGNIHFLYRDPETKKLCMNQTTCWGKQRIDQLYGLMNTNGLYKFKAKVNDKGFLAWIRGITQVTEPTDVPEIKDVEGLPLAEIVDVIDSYELVKGYVGRVIEPQGVKLGFEIDDLGAAPPLTIWYGGQYSKMDPDVIHNVSSQLARGSHVAVYGYISGIGPDVKLSASNIWFLD
jgi:hypothetical protein